MNGNSHECDHSRGTPRHRSSALTICHHCRDFLCSICGVTIDWHEGLCVTNPGVQWRYCAKDTCVAAEGPYHALPVDEMIRYRGELRAKCVLRHLQDRGIEPQTPPSNALVTQTTARGAQRIFITPRAFVLDPGEACWCNLGKDCTGSHEVYFAEPVNRCGLCGQTFRIAADDPHWLTGRGPICPTRRGSVN
jgi:hypothetical protein